MKKIGIFTLAIAIVFTLFISGAHHVFAADLIQGGPLEGDALLADPDPNGDDLREDHSAVETWITRWYGPDGNYENSNGFGEEAETDHISVGTGDQITQVSLSTMAGLLMTQDVDVEWPDHGGTRAWTVFEIDPTDGNNMNRDGPADDLETYAVIVIDAPSDMTAIMSPAHDDHAKSGLTAKNGTTIPGGQVLHKRFFTTSKSTYKKVATCCFIGVVKAAALHTSTSTLTTQPMTLLLFTRKIQRISRVSSMKSHR